MFFQKILVLIAILSITSCSLGSTKDFFKKNNFLNKKPKETQIRMVDLNGEYRAIKKQIPTLNSAFINKQKNLSQYERLTKEQKLKNIEIIEIKEDIQDIEVKKDIENTNEDFGGNFGPSDEPLLELDNKDNEGGKKKLVYNKTTSPNNLNIETKLLSQNKEESSEIKENKITKVYKTSKIYKTKQDISLKGMFVQVGSFISEEGAKITLENSQKVAKSSIKKVKVNNKTVYKVLVGPAENNSEAKYLLEKVKINGFKDAFIIRIK